MNNLVKNVAVTSNTVCCFPDVLVYMSLSAKDLMVLNFDSGEDFRESLAWTAWRSNQSILKEINPEYSLKGLRLKLQ